MKNKSFLSVLAAGCLSAWSMVMVAGCNPNAASLETTPSTETQPAVDDHGHAHEETGPHEGHLVEIGDEQLHAEWTHHDASGEVVVYLLDSTAKLDEAISAGAIIIKTKIGDTEKSYELTAVSAENGRSSKFSVSDPSLVEALKAVGPGIEATIVVNLDGAELVGKFEQHVHGAHKH